MRGFAGFFFEVLYPGLWALCFGFVILLAARRARQGRLPSNKYSNKYSDKYFRALTPRKALVGSILSFLVMGIVLGIGCSNLKFHYDLWTLKPQDVREIQIGGRRFADAASIKLIVDDLKSSEWYSVEHGGWGDETSIVVRFASGSQWQLRAGYHFAQHGAVVLRSSGPNGRGWALGQVFSVSLPQTLDELGVPLSLCDISHGHPCRVASTRTAR